MGVSPDGAVARRFAEALFQHAQDQAELELWVQAHDALGETLERWRLPGTNTPNGGRAAPPCA